MSSKAGKARLYGDGGRMVKRARKGTGPVAAATVQRAVAAAVRRANEKKGMDTLLNVGGVVSTTNTNDDCIVLNLIQQGNGSWNRVGRKVAIQSIRLRGIARLTSGPAATSGDLNSNNLRMVVVWDKQPSGAAIPTFDTVFGLTQQDGTESTTYLAPVKYDNMDRFSVLRDCFIPMNVELFNNAGGASDLARYEFPFDEFIKLGNREVVFLGQSNPMTIADISTGGLYVYFRAAGDSASANQVSIATESFARLRYIDP